MGAPEGEKGCKGREERMQMTCIHEVSPLRHAYPLTMYVNRAMARAVSGSGNNDTVVATPIAPSQPYQHSTNCNRTGPTPIVQTVEEIGPPNTVTGYCCIHTVLYGHFAEPSTGLSNPQILSFKAVISITDQTNRL